MKLKIIGGVSVVCPADSTIRQIVDSAWLNDGIVVTRIFEDNGGEVLRPDWNRVPKGDLRANVA